MQTRIIAGIVLAVFFCFLAVIETCAATLVVTKTADTADGVCDADCSLREAVAAAVPDDTILFSPLFDTPQTITLLNGQIAFSKNLTITGPGSNLLTVSGNHANRVFHISGGVVVSMSGVTLKDGLVNILNDCFGGGIRLIDSTLTLNGMVIRNNKARFVNTNPPFEAGFGGAIASENSILSVTNSTISNNEAPDSGGGIYSDSGTLHVINSTVSNNFGSGIAGSGDVSSPHILMNVVASTFDGNTGTAVRGSNGTTSVLDTTITNNGLGISDSDSTSVLTVERSTIALNQAGGLFLRGAATICHSSIRNNYSLGDGGGIRSTADINIYNSSITDNRSSGSGGGIFHSLARLNVTNSTISGNIADGTGSGNGLGGGIYNRSNEVNPGGATVVTNSTIANNQSRVLGGGFRNDSHGTFTLRNTIVAGNEATDGSNDGSGTAISEGFNLIGNTSGSTGWTATDLLNINPLLAAMGNNGGYTKTHALMPGSPAINAGSNALAVHPVTKIPLAFDQRGLPRIVNGTVDIGAYESNIASTPVSLTGRVLNSAGRGISNARLKLTNSKGIAIYTQTNPFGYYRFLNLPPGTTYTVEIFHKSYQFESPQTVTVDNNRTDLNFTGF